MKGFQENNVDNSVIWLHYFLTKSRALLAVIKIIAIAITLDSRRNIQYTPGLDWSKYHNKCRLHGITANIDS
jgi:hypothetical protein